MDNSEDELQIVFDSTIPICVTDLDYNIMTANEPFKSVFASSDDKCYEVRPGDTCQTDKCPLKQIKNGQEHVEVEVEKTFDNAEDKVFLEIATPYRDESGKLKGMITSFQDITKRKEMELKLKETLEEKEEILDEIQSLLDNNMRVINELLTLHSSLDDPEDAFAAMGSNVLNEMLKIKSNLNPLNTEESHSNKES